MDWEGSFFWEIFAVGGPKIKVYVKINIFIMEQNIISTKKSRQGNRYKFSNNVYFMKYIKKLYLKLSLNLKKVKGLK